MRESAKMLDPLTPPQPTDGLPDAAPRNWVDRLAPAAWQPYLQLMRLDRPIGAWLLLFPCWWGQALAEETIGRAHPSLGYLALFFAGAFVMRAAGCTYNDMIDKDYDAAVARTAARPIPSGRVSMAGARLLLAALCLAGLLLLLQFNAFTIRLGAGSLLLVAIYPFMKRFTYWPQLVLGLAFSWGALVGWSAITATLAPAPIALYAGAVLWTIGYDTIYAHQDKEGDLLVGLKSTALKFGAATKAWVGAFYAGAACCWAAAGVLAEARLLYFLALALAGMQLAWQVLTLKPDVPRNCLARFISNRLVGWMLLIGIAADMLFGQSVHP
jgi:4-hydroxybenzoate polyprenyltransferase